MLTPSIPLVGLSGLYLQYQISSHTVPEWIPRGGSRYNLRRYNPSSTSSPPRLTITRPTAHAGHHIILLWNAHAPVHADEKSHQLWSDFESIFMGAFQSLRDDIEFTLRAVMTLICDNCDLWWYWTYWLQLLTRCRACLEGCPGLASITIIRLWRWAAAMHCSHQAILD